MLNAEEFVRNLPQSNCSISVLESVCYGINEAHYLNGLPTPSNLFKNIFGNWQNLSPKKEPFIPVPVNELCTSFASPYSSLSGLRLSAICVTTYAAFPRFKITTLRYCDLKFCDSQE